MRAAREIQKIHAEPLEGIRIVQNEEDLTDIRAVIDGPAGTPYAGGSFLMKLTLSNDFPSVPPKGYFLTKIFHPNVSKLGEICVNTLKKDWKPELGIRHVLLTVKCLLIVPNPESALNEEAGKLLLEAYDEYAKMAKMMTEIHALSSKAGEASSTAASSTCASSCAAETSAAAGKVAASAASKPAVKTEKAKVDAKRSLKRL
ncbi:ubiquitin-conjugating enzyme E2S [Capsaspora owczarzaki ATCC 30864]|uniref:E2 ubiquitin-conjugating enzyme n=2 Tax=Capsaspora owczarzaki (strain ATCC 30864) TaxID=595528 RepID=A0A0D2WYE1_CAPO3|nr:ubiquitin-conjugating enzyme E2S [Capsaspora owczarzaki ATCC 30864]